MPSITIILHVITCFQSFINSITKGNDRKDFWDIENMDIILLFVIFVLFNPNY
jgi:hypothetical protein